MLTLKDFDYALPKELIAPYPERKRSDARLLVLHRKTGNLEHRIFRNLTEYLQTGDLLVLNNTKVLPARLFGRKPTGGKVEALLLKSLEGGVWEALLKPCGRIKKSAVISFGENGVRLEGEVLDEPDDKTGIRRIRFVNVGAGPCARPVKGPAALYGVCLAQGNHTAKQCREATSRFAGRGLPLPSVLEKIGHIPLPPYIDRPDEEIDRQLYQTVFAEKEGAIASPTAGLHFDKELLEALRLKGVEICFVTLHVSYGTFQSVQTEDLSQHEMYEEGFEITERAAEQIERALREKRRIIACGTTVVRVLETVVGAGPRACPQGNHTAKQCREATSRFAGRGLPLQTIKGATRIFIYPPYEFKIVDAMITNFHLPRTTLLMLVSAFADRDLIFHAYEEAIRERYRFYSYGDAMLIL